MPVIKRVGNAEILLEECKQKSVSNFLIVITFLILVSFTASIYYQSFALLILVTGFLIVAVICIPLWFTVRDAYKILYGFANPKRGIIILKTDNPEADRIDICKAAKEIEAELIEIQTREARLEEMARKCK